MTGWFVRDYSQDDLEAVILLDTESGTTGEPPLFQLSDTVAALKPFIRPWWPWPTM